MHRHRIRAFVAGAGGGEKDVPVTIFAAGQYVRYIAGTGLMTTSLGPGTTVVNRITTWGDTTGTQLLQTPVSLDNAGNMTDLVTLDGQDAPRITATLATATPTTGKLTTWASNSAPWKLDSTVTLQVVNIDGIDTLYGVGGINGRDPAKWVEGPATAVDNEVPRYDGTTGKLIQRSGITLSDAGDLSGLGTINTVDVTTFGTLNQRWLYGPKTTTINALVQWNSTSGGLVTVSPVYYNPVGDTLSGFTNLTLTNLAATNITTSTINSRDPNKWVEGPSSATNGALATFSGTTGKLIASPTTITATGGALSNVGTINGIDPSTWVIGPASSTSGRLATFNGTSGKVIQDGSGISAVGGALSNVGTINGRDPARWLQGPTSSTNNGVPRFIGTSGALATDSVVTIDSSGAMDGVTAFNGLSVPTNNWVRGPNFGSTVNAVALWGSTDGRVAKDSVVMIDGGGNFTGAGSINGTYVESHVFRHLPGGADTLIDTNNWATGDSLTWIGNATRFRPKNSFVSMLSGASIGGTLTSPSGANLTMPNRNSVYKLTWVIGLSLGDITAGVIVSVAWSSGSGMWCASMGAGSQWSISSGSTITIPGGATNPPTPVLRVDLCIAGTAPACTLTLASTGAGFTTIAGSSCVAMEQ